MIDNSIAEGTIINTLTVAEISLFMEDLHKLECCKNLQPIEDIGELELRIFYSDGNIDLIGSRANGYVEGGVLHISGWYYYRESALCDLFTAYSN